MDEEDNQISNLEDKIAGNKQLEQQREPWLVGLSGLSTGLRTKGSLV